MYSPVRPIFSSNLYPSTVPFATEWLGSSVLTAGQPTSSLGKPTSTLALPSGARSRGLALRQAGVDSKTQKHPGYSLFEWNRMCENERDLAGVGGRLLYVTEDELSKHNTEHDIWTAIRGMCVIIHLTN